MTCLHIGSAVNHGSRHDLSPDFLQGTNIRSIPSECYSRTNSQMRSIQATKRLLGTHFALSHRLRRPRPIWTSLTASATNSITYNYVTALGPGDQPVRDGSPGPELTPIMAGKPICPACRSNEHHQAGNPTGRQASTRFAMAARPVVRNRSAGDIQRQRALDYHNAAGGGNRTAGISVGPAVGEVDRAMGQLHRVPCA